MTVIHRPRPYRSGLMLNPPVAVGGHAFTRTSHPGQWHCERCHTLTHDIHHTTTTGTCTGLAAAITTGAPMNPTPEPTIPIRFSIDITTTITDTFDIPISSIINDTRRTVERHQSLKLDEPGWADVVDNIVCDFEPANGWLPRITADTDFSIDCVGWAPADCNEALSALITAELQRLADEADPERARFRPTVGQMDIFGLEVTE